MCAGVSICAIAIVVLHDSTVPNDRKHSKLFCWLCHCTHIAITVFGAIHVLGWLEHLPFHRDFLRRHVHESPLVFRVRNKKETIYCYSEEEKEKALKKLGQKSEITRFKGLGEISPDEFGLFIGEHIRLDPVKFIGSERDLSETLTFYMGKNTPKRQEFIIHNLKVELDQLEK